MRYIDPTGLYTEAEYNEGQRIANEMSENEITYEGSQGTYWFTSYVNEKGVSIIYSSFFTNQKAEAGTGINVSEGSKQAPQILLDTVKDAMQQDRFKPGYPNYKGWHDLGYEKKPGAQPHMTHCNELAGNVLDDELGYNLSPIYTNKTWGNTGATKMCENAATAAKNPYSGVKEVTPEEAQRLANEGVGVIGLAKNPDPTKASHAGVVVPDKNAYDSKKGPLIGQAGEVNGIRYANKSFPGLEEAHYYVFNKK